MLQYTATGVNNMQENHIIVPYLDQSYLTDYIQEGAIGTCYRIGNNEVFKKYHAEISNYEDYRRLVGITSPSFAFPKKSIYLEKYGEEYFLGYIMDYIEGKRLSQLDGNIDIKDMFNKIDLLEKEIKLLVEQKNVIMYDLHEENLLVTPNNEIKVIDTDMFTFGYYDIIDNYKDNMRELGLTILHFFLKDYKFKSEKLQDYYYRCIFDGRVKPSYLLNEALLEMEKELKESINTFNDLNRSIKLIKK